MIGIIFLLSFAIGSQHCLQEKKELYIDSKELARLGEIGINGLELSNLLACQKMLNGKYDKKKDNCTIKAEVCFNK